MSSHHSGSSYGSARSPAGAAAAGQSGGPVDAYTAEMRDRQARGKDPYESSDGSTDWSDDGTKYRRPGSGKDEPFSVRERRRVAAQVLDSPELLMMAAQRDNESIPATRLRYTRMLCGLKEPPAPMPARKKAQRSAGGSSSHVPSGSTPGRSSRKEAR